MKLVVLLLYTVVVVFFGCRSNQELLVYEKLPQFQKCLRYTDFFEVSKCDMAEMKKQNTQVGITLDVSKQRLKNLYNQDNRCTYRNKLPRPVGCDISTVPRRGNRPVVGRRIGN